MSEQEKRNIRAMALLEVEEARAHLALLQAKLGNWQKLQEKVYHLLARGRRWDAHMESVAKEARRDVLLHKEEIAQVMDLEAILRLDEEVLQAVDGLSIAIKNKKALGFD